MEVYSVNLSKVASVLTLSVAFAASLAAAPQAAKPATPAAPAKATDQPKPAAAKPAAAKPEMVKAADLPKPVTDAVMKAHPKGEITTATKAMKGTDAWYTVSVKDGGKTSKMVLDAMGKPAPAKKK
jgi:hypothetical protein